MGSLALEETYWDEVVLERRVVVNGGAVVVVGLNLSFLRTWVAIDLQGGTKTSITDITATEEKARSDTQKKKKLILIYSETQK